MTNPAATLFVLVEIELEPGASADYRAAVTANAAASLRDEPRCRRFDVAGDPASPDRIVLFEITTTTRRSNAT